MLFLACASFLHTSNQACFYSVNFVFVFHDALVCMLVCFFINVCSDLTKMLLQIACIIVVYICVYLTL